MAVNSNDDARFKVVEYSPEKAEMIGYSNYSYWKSVFHNFLKKKSAVALLIVFVALVVFSFVALVIGKYDYRNLVTDSSKGFILPNSEFLPVSLQSVSVCLVLLLVFFGDMFVS